MTTSAQEGNRTPNRKVITLAALPLCYLGLFGCFTGQYCFEHSAAGVRSVHCFSEERSCENALLKVPRAINADKSLHCHKDWREGEESNRRPPTSEDAGALASELPSHLEDRGGFEPPTQQVISLSALTSELPVLGAGKGFEPFKPPMWSLHKIMLLLPPFDFLAKAGSQALSGLVSDLEQALGLLTSFGPNRAHRTLQPKCVGCHYQKAALKYSVSALLSLPRAQQRKFQVGALRFQLQRREQPAPQSYRLGGRF